MFISVLNYKIEFVVRPPRPVLFHPLKFLPTFEPLETGQIIEPLPLVGWEGIAHHSSPASPWDFKLMRQLLSMGDADQERLRQHQIARQLDKYNVNIRQGQDIQIGNHFYVEWNDEAIPALQKST